VPRPPPYSPDFTPIEAMFSKFKAWLRRPGARTRDRLCAALPEALKTITPDDILGWFGHAGLCVSQT
jgi:transposase